MKPFIMSIVCFSISLSAADNQTYQTQEWMAIEYAQHNKRYIEFFFHCFATNKIDLENKDIISFGCGTGEIEYKLAQHAKSVHGIDASKNMVEYAKKQYPHQNNLSFQYCPIEEFQSSKLYDIAIAASCFNFFKTERAIQTINKHLKSGGIFFANIDTTNNPETFGMQVFNDMKDTIPIIGTLLKSLPDPTGISRHSPGNLHIMLSNAAMDIKRQIMISYDITMNEQEWKYAQLPLLLSTSGAQMLINNTSDIWLAQKTAAAAFWCLTLSEKEKQEHDAPFFPECNNPLVEKLRNNNLCRYLFNNFLKRCLQKLKKNADGTYTWTYETTLYVCEKKHEK